MTYCEAILPEHGALSQEAAMVASRLPLHLDGDTGRKGDEFPKFEIIKFKIIEKWQQQRCNKNAIDAAERAADQPLDDGHPERAGGGQEVPGREQQFVR